MTKGDAALFLALLDHFTRQESQHRRDGFLIVGDVLYEGRPGADDKTLAQDDAPIFLRADRGGEEGGHWSPLPSTKVEAQHLTLVAPSDAIVTLTGLKANTARVLAELPKARWAHFATHGFFADAKFRSQSQMQRESFATRSFLVGRERKSAAGRNPLVLSGLVLAGANVPRQLDSLGIPRGDDGILTAEAIAGMNLLGLELAVLSACETALGDVAGGEGVYGLQRAFHTAGAHNVVASLWKVSDEATVALMRLFYHKLWVEQKPPGKALREAQLALYRHPEQIGARARSRSPDFSKIVSHTKTGSRTANTRLWAGFVISCAAR